MRLKTHKKQIIREIERVWKRIPYSKQVSDMLEYRNDDFEYNETKELCLGKNWWEIPDKYFDLGYASLFFLHGEAFHYFLPAFMLYAIRDDWTMESLLNGRFLPPKNDSFESFAEMFSNYSIEEKQCILHFLEYAKSYYSHKDTELNNRKMKQIDDAIERYWMGMGMERVRKEPETVNRERFDYTEWHGILSEGKSIDDIAEGIRRKRNDA